MLSNDGATSAARVRTLVFVQQLADNSSELESVGDLLPLLLKVTAVNMST